MKAKIYNVKVESGSLFCGELDMDDLSVAEQWSLGINPNDPAKYDKEIFVSGEFSMRLYSDGSDPMLESTDAHYLVTVGSTNILIPCGRFDEPDLEASLCRAYDWQQEYERQLDSSESYWEDMNLRSSWED